MSSDVCQTLGCENTPAESGFCAECADISPGILDDADPEPVNPSGNPTDTDVRHSSDTKNQPTGTPEGDAVTVGGEAGSRDVTLDSLENHECDGEHENAGSSDTAESEPCAGGSSEREPPEKSGQTAFVDAAEWFHAQLDREIADHTDEGDHPDRPTTAREYFREERGWTDTTLDEALLGYAPSTRTGLLDHLMREGYGREAILGTGLFTEDLRPLWQGRYVLPYFDEDGTPVYAISRATGDEGGGAVGYDGHPDDGMSGKYAKPAHSKEYAHVEEPIFGLGSVEDGQPVLITEGIADAITARQSGYPCLSPVTTRFKHEDRERLVEALGDRDVPRVYVVGDAERAGSDLDEEDRLTIQQGGEGLRGALDTAAHLARNDVEARVAELPRAGLDKVDLDGYLREWSTTLDPVLASAKPAREHPDHDPQDAAVEAARTVRNHTAPASESETGDHSALFDLDLRDVAGVGEGYRGVNPLGHHGESENYAVTVGDGRDGVLYDHKHKVAYNALTYLLVEAGERKADSPNGRLDDEEILVAWREAKDERLIPDDDPIPHRALQHVALSRGLCESGDIKDGWKLPAEAYNGALDTVREEHDLDPGRRAISGDGSSGGVEPVPTIPFAMLSRPRDELVRFARKRGLEWPATDEARDRLGEALREEFRDEGYTVLDAPTGLGKTHEASSTFWREIDEAVTGGRPVVLFASTTDARDEAKRMARKAGLDVKMLLGYKEACDVAGGRFDPENVDEDDDREPRFIEGVPAGRWFETRVEDKGIAVSSAHSKAERLAEQGYVATTKEASANGRGDAVLPCCPEELKCRTETQWPADGWTDDDDIPRYDLVVATDPFAYVPGLRANTNIIHDEQPDYTVEFGDTDEQHQQRIQRAVTAFLKAANAPAQADTFAGLVQVAKHGFSFNEHANPDEQGDMGERYDDLFDALQTELPRDWFFEHEDAHTLAPALAQAIYKAATEDTDENGRRMARTSHEPPRLDAGASDDDAWNRTWVTVVLDDEDNVTTVRDAPDFSTARSVVGLDAWPNPYLWQRNVHPAVTTERVLDPEERSLWRRLEQGKLVVGVGDATRPAGSGGEFFTESHADALVSQLREEFGEDFRAAGSASAVETRMRELLAESGVALPDDPDRDFSDEAREAGLDGGTMHFGEEKSRNDFADEVVGLVYGCIDPGDDYVLDLAAECDLDVRPARHECPKCDGDGCGPGETDCLDGTRRSHGREFVGEDGEDGSALLASVRENHVAQMAGRFGRGESVDQSVVFVATDATPPGLVDVRVPGVLWLARPNQKQRALVEHLRANPSSTAREASDAVGCSKEHARQVFAALVEQGKATVTDAGGDHGADVYRWLSGASASATPFASVDLTPEDLDADTTNSDVWSTYTWQLAVSPDEPDSVTTDPPSSPEQPPSPSAQIALGAFGGVDPPPEQSD